MTALEAFPSFKPAATVPILHPGEVQLWLVPLDAAIDDTAILSADEWLRAGRFHHALDRQRYIRSRIALREILGACVPAPARSLHFIRGGSGKPTLPDSLLRFNLSHSDGLMLLAVTHGREVGVDLEAVRENLSFEMLSDHYFPPEDQWQLRITPESQRRAKFFELWTRTEAQLKARGLGLGEPPRFEDADRFTLHSFTPADGFAAALVVEGEDFEITCLRWMK